MKNISTINPAIMENTEYSIGKVHSLFINLKWVCPLIMAYHYASFHF